MRASAISLRRVSALLLLCAALFSAPPSTPRSPSAGREQVLYGVAPAEAAWTLKKIAGEQWRSGSRLLAPTLGRTHSEIKAALSSRPPEVQEQYKALAEAYADLHEASLKGRTGVADQMAVIRAQARRVVDEMLGPQAGQESATRAQQQLYRAEQADAARAGDPLQGRMIELQQQHEQQMQQLIQELKLRQQQERRQAEREIALARQRQLQLQHELQNVQALLGAARSGIGQAHKQLSALTSAQQQIEQLAQRSGSLAAVVEQTPEGAFPPSSLLKEVAALFQNSSNLKAVIGAGLTGINRLLSQAADTLRKGENKAEALSTLGNDGRSYAEGLLNDAAIMLVSLQSIEGMLQQAVTALDGKQLELEASFNALKAAVSDRQEKAVEALTDKARAVVTFAAGSATRLMETSQEAAREILDALGAAIESTGNAVVNWQAKYEEHKQLANLAAQWVERSKAEREKLDAAANTAAEIFSVAATLSQALQQKISLSSLAEAQQSLFKLKSAAREMQARLFSQVNVLGQLVQRGVTALHSQLGPNRQPGAPEGSSPFPGGFPQQQSPSQLPGFP